MSAVAERPRTQLALAPKGDGRELRHSDGGRLTLEEQLERLWEGLSAVGVADCPMCGNRMEHTGSEARCTSCGTTLA